MGSWLVSPQGATGVIIAAWLVVVDRRIDRVRSVFVAVSPALVDVLTFGKVSLRAPRSWWSLGRRRCSGGGRSLRFNLRRPVAIGLGVVLLMAMLQRIVPTITRWAEPRA